MKSILMAAVAATLVPMAVQAAASDVLQGTAQAVNNSGLSYQATPDIVGQTSTATIASGGNPLYAATAPKYSGVVALIMDEGAAGKFICSGALLADRMSILTAGHCVSTGAGTANPVSTTAYFYNGGDPDFVVAQNPAATAIPISRYTVDAGYTGEVIDQNDIAVLRLATAAPDWATSYDIYANGDLTGLEYNVAGYGARSDVGGALGADLGTGRLRQGDNTYAFRLGDPDFDAEGGWGFLTPAQYAYSYVSDFDDGTAAHDTACQLAAAFLLSGSKYCNTGIGADEVSTAGGDSGGPQFVDGKIASITGYGLTFGTDFGDIDDKLNDSFGELNGFIPTFIHEGFINGAMGVPEPATWGLMILGFGLTGASVRRRRAAVA